MDWPTVASCSCNKLISYRSIASSSLDQCDGHENPEDHANGYDEHEGHAAGGHAGMQHSNGMAAS